MSFWSPKHLWSMTEKQKLKTQAGRACDRCSNQSRSHIVDITLLAFGQLECFTERKSGSGKVLLFMLIQLQHPARLYSAEKLVALSTLLPACFDLQIFKCGRGVVRLEPKSPFQHLFNVTFPKYIWHPLVYTHLQFGKQFHSSTSVPIDACE